MDDADLFAFKQFLRLPLLDKSGSILHLAADSAHEPDGDPELLRDVPAPALLNQPGVSDCNDVRTAELVELASAILVTQPALVRLQPVLFLREEYATGTGTPAFQRLLVYLRRSRLHLHSVADCFDGTHTHVDVLPQFSDPNPEILELLIRQSVVI